MSTWRPSKTKKAQKTEILCVPVRLIIRLFSAQINWTGKHIKINVDRIDTLHSGCVLTSGGLSDGENYYSASSCASVFRDKESISFLVHGYYPSLWKDSGATKIHNTFKIEDFKVLN